MTTDEKIEREENAIILAPSNYYGGLTISQVSGKYYWSVENWDGHSWSEIAEATYNALLAQKELDDAN